MEKTNAMRLLEQAGVAYAPHAYATDDGRIDAQSVAEKLGAEPARVFKTLVTCGSDGMHYVFLVPAGSELDLKRAARAAGVKSIAMLPLAKLFALTGYVHGGCSPVGMKKAFPTWIDESAILYDTVFFSGGRVGLNLAANPEALAGLIGAAFAGLCRDETS